MQETETIGTCCFDNPGTQINPANLDNTIAAGSVSAYDGIGEGCYLATAYMPVQNYTAGFTPREALEHGTMFPELLRPCFTC
ncbi:MAG: spore coat associated protein CotJA [Eubacteriales bacterium]|nr:spore coat associated protein CotJA [Eubacteriales bacterium]